MTATTSATQQPVRYDIIVLGSGVAGGHVAARCSEAGLSVALVEHDGFGGTCPLRGCEPKKVLADATHTVERFAHAAGHGVLGQATLDWKELMAFKRSFTDDLPPKIKHHYEKKGIVTYTEPGRFTGPDTIITGQTLLRGSYICIATGAATRRLNLPGAEHMITSRQFLELETMPKRMIFVGGGFIALEMAHIAAVAGAEVHIVHRSERLLRKFDADLVNRLREQMEHIGITFHLNCPPRSVRSTGAGLELVAGDTQDDTAEHVFAADCIVNAAGRPPALDELNLEAGTVQVKRGGVEVNSRMQSVSNPIVYAAGDVVRTSMPLTPVATLEADVIVRNILDGTPHHVSYGPVPYALFTYPPLAAVGLLEEEAREQGKDVDVIQGDASGWSEYERIGQRCAGYKLLVEKKTRQILGAHVLGDAAEETINLFALAMRTGVTADDLQSMPWAYPSFGYAIKYMFR